MLDIAKKVLMRILGTCGVEHILYKFTHPSKQPFSCPICHYRGPFADWSPETGLRKHAKCPRCHALERHRLQALVMSRLADKYDFSKMSLLHFAPEAFFKKRFAKWFATYTTADLAQVGVDYNVDLTDLPFSDKSFDIVYASHVLEHIKEDREALSEIRRILKLGGLAILPVPLIATTTVEYPVANPHEEGHVRAPGLDYFERYKEFFDSVEGLGTEDFPLDYQLYTYEDRSAWPIETMPLRPTMLGEKHVDVVPICLVARQ